MIRLMSDRQVVTWRRKQGAGGVRCGVRTRASKVILQLPRKARPSSARASGRRASGAAGAAGRAQEPTHGARLGAHTLRTGAARALVLRATAATGALAFMLMLMVVAILKDLAKETSCAFSGADGAKLT